jgi:hypothetical protein
MGGVSAADVALLRPPMALWGYQVQATEEALQAIARSVTARDATIAALRRQLDELQDERTWRIADFADGNPGSSGQGWPPTGPASGGPAWPATEAESSGQGWPASEATADEGAWPVAGEPEAGESWPAAGEADDNRTWPVAPDQTADGETWPPPGQARNWPVPPSASADE